MRRARIEDLHVIVASLADFWGARDVRGLHNSLYVHEFGETALVVRAGAGRVRAYLLGFLTPARVGYVHVVGVHRAHRREGLATRLYGEFESLVRARGARAMKAITSPGNEASLAFHRALGFTAAEVPGYSASGEPRIVLWRELRGEAGAPAGLSN